MGQLADLVGLDVGSELLAVATAALVMMTRSELRLMWRLVLLWS